MSKTSLSTAALLGMGMTLGLGYPSAFSQSSAPAQPSAPLKEIHVDRSCKILQEESNALSEIRPADLENDHVICHLESVHTSHHVEASLDDGVMQKSKVTVAEREYLLQNVTSTPVTFVVEHSVPEDWKVDSDPQPVKVVDNTAFFRVNAEPGQIVRLHVGEHHAEPMTDSGGAGH
ncbi:hypothetical protein HNQ77_001582 [Silvibacterium bohemicum]|uniref:Uncharacterized protein n=1 Tax=Silvibacterium bohemicum TaxID=1577686 RepID=A0A841JQI9_9BACT|nr:hypothetical protein [Silvibacterium bohemicum]MBB6143633.1 hypothetical protein [Silvibacterium bohemicum]